MTINHQSLRRQVETIGIESQNDLGSCLDHYNNNGYAVLKSVVSKDVCKKIISHFRSTIKPSKSHFYRQTAAGLAEAHKFNDHGLMINSILNLHDLNSHKYPEFLSSLYEAYSSPLIHAFFRKIYDTNPIVVQTMYFEGNPATWAHQDLYYLESSDSRGLVAIWIALEDIDQTAGRFFVCPGSHKIEIDKNSGEFNFSFNHSKYKNHVQQLIIDHKLETVAPALNAGDVLFWSSRTIHGSLLTQDSGKSRNSLTAHFIPQNSDLIAFQSIKRKLNMKEHRGVSYHHPKDLDKLSNRLVLSFEKEFPRTYNLLKRHIVRSYTK